MEGSAQALDRAAGKKMLVTSCQATTGEASDETGPEADLFGVDEGAGEKKTENPDRLFFRLLASEIREDTIDSPAP